MNQELVETNEMLFSKRKAMVDPTLSTTSSDLEAVIASCKAKWQEAFGRPPGGELAVIKSPSQKPRTALECSGVGPRHCQSSFENFEGNEQLVKTCKQLISQGNDVILSGQTGCGKTHLAVAMVREFLQRNQGAVFITVPQLLLKIRAAFDPHPAQTEQELVERYSSCKLLVLDDLGAEKTTEFSIATLYLILDQRIRHMRQTIVTTNLTLQAIEHSLGARIASRLAGMRVIRIAMPDWRKNRLGPQS